MFLGKSRKYEKHCQCFIDRKVFIYWELNRGTVILYLNRHLDFELEELLSSPLPITTKTRRTIISNSLLF